MPQALVAQPAVEALNERVLLRFAGLDVVPVDARSFAPGQDRHAGELRAIVGNARRRLAPDRDDGIQLARNTGARERGVRHQGKAFACAVVGDRQCPEPAAIRQCVGDEIQRPALVRPRGKCQRRPQSECALAAATLPHLQAFLAVEPPEPLLVHRQAVSLQQEMQTPIPEPATYLRQLPDAQPNSTIVRPPAAVAHR